MVVDSVREGDWGVVELADEVVKSGKHLEIVYTAQ